MARSFGLFFVAIVVISMYDLSSWTDLDPTVPGITHRYLDERGDIEDFDDEEPISTNTTMLVGIFTMISDKDADQRQLIRDTYIQQNEDSGRVCHLKKYLKTGADSGCTLIYAFVAGGRQDGPMMHIDDSMPIALEHSLMPMYRDIDPEDDVVYLNIKENMEDGKSLTWFKYAASIAEEHGIHYIAKTDSDSYLNLEELLRVTSYDLPATPSNRRIYGGRPWPDYFGESVYMAGQFYFVSSDLAHYVTNLMDPFDREKMTSRVEDLDFGKYVMSHHRPIKLITFHSNLFWKHPLKTRDEWLKYHELKSGAVLRDKFGYYQHLCDDWSKPNYTQRGQNE